MKKLALALVAVAATFTAGSAAAADLPARTYSKAPPPPVAVASWTGCYISGGGGYGLFHQENTGFLDGPPRVQATPTATAGGQGWFGTVQGGCDYQFSTGPWGIVIGAFADYDFADIHGQVGLPGGVFYGNEKLSSQWAVGGRAGILITPNLLSYVSAGYTEAKFDQTNFAAFAGLVPIPAADAYWSSRTYSGWFIGTGYEYALNFLPGLYWKTEYRASQLDRETNPLYFAGTNVLTGASVDSEKWVHAVRSQLVYRFNWGGPIVAKY